MSRRVVCRPSACRALQAIGEEAAAGADAAAARPAASGRTPTHDRALLLGAFSEPARTPVGHINVGSRAVFAAIVGNSGVAGIKFAGWICTGSASLLSESIHSIADLGNQATSSHPRCSLCSISAHSVRGMSAGPPRRRAAAVAPRRRRAAAVRVWLRGLRLGNDLRRRHRVACAAAGASSQPAPDHRLGVSTFILGAGASVQHGRLSADSLGSVYEVSRKCLGAARASLCRHAFPSSRSPPAARRRCTTASRACSRRTRSTLCRRRSACSSRRAVLDGGRAVAWLGHDVSPTRPSQAGVLEGYTLSVAWHEMQA